MEQWKPSCGLQCNSLSHILKCLPISETCSVTELCKCRPSVETKLLHCRTNALYTPVYHDVKFSLRFQSVTSAVLSTCACTSLQFRCAGNQLRCAGQLLSRQIFGVLPQVANLLKLAAGPCLVLLPALFIGSRLLVVAAFNGSLLLHERTAPTGYYYEPGSLVCV